MIAYTLILIWVLLFFELRFHREPHAALSCVVSAFFYIVLLFTHDKIEDYYAYYLFYIKVYMVWLTAMLVLRANKAALAMLTAATLVLPISNYYLTAHAFFYGWYEFNYIVLHGLFVTSLTYLPHRWPDKFGYKKKAKKQSFTAFVPVPHRATSKVVN